MSSDPQQHDAVRPDAAIKTDDDDAREETPFQDEVADQQPEDAEEAEEESDGEEDDSDEEDDEDDEEEEEPKLKYARMTAQLSAVYRNGDGTSSFLVAGDKMIIGTHNGNIHVVSLPSFQAVRPYRAHSASVTSVSISPFPPPSSIAKRDARVPSQAQPASPRPQSSMSSARNAPPEVPNTPSNAIYIATSSLDGNVCVASLVDRRDVQLRNFARPVQAVALSPDYRNDRTYVSGGLAGQLVLTVGGRSGTSSTSTTTGTAAATASGWLGAIGLSANTGKDTVLHYGEGTISAIKWSRSGKFIVWANEHGIKIMRSHLHLDSADADDVWKRIAHIDRPQDPEWEEMASVWKARIEWIDETALESNVSTLPGLASPAKKKRKSEAEKLLVGWGGTIWIINVHPQGTGIGKDIGERTAGRAEIVKILKLDCIVSGLSLYTPNLLLALCYIHPEEGKSASPTRHKGRGSTATDKIRGGIKRRRNAVPPELRIIDLETSQEVEVDSDDLKVNYFDQLAAADYHLDVQHATRNTELAQTSRGTLEVLSGVGTGMWNATINAASLMSGAASVRSMGSKSDGESATNITPSSSLAKLRAGGRFIPPIAAAPGLKIYIHSPYDCVLAANRDLQDHLTWILDQEKYEQAWELINEHPEAVSAIESGSEQSLKNQSSVDDFFDDAATITSIDDSPSKRMFSAVEKEKRRIGELWIQQLIAADDWDEAGRTCGKVLGTSTRWDHWMWTFAGANKFDEITPYLPTNPLHPPLPSTIYEVALGHYITNNRVRMGELLETWPPELFTISIITTALENLLKYRDVRKDSVEDGQVGRDWRIVQENLGKLYIADGRPREALKCYIRLQDAEMAMGLIRDFHLVDAISDDIPGLILLRISKEQLRSAPISELEEASSEAITLLVREAHHGLVRPEVVVKQLQERDLPLFLFFYLRSLWNGEGIDESAGKYVEQMRSDSKAVVDEFADLAVEHFAIYDRPLLMEFLKTSTSYAFEKASQICEDHEYVPELVYLYSKTGQMKRALFLIIDRLADVSQAIEFTKQQDDPDLWDDLLNYSMDKPRFIRGLLEEVGTAIDPVRLVRRIPEGLAIDGLREGLSRMIKEYEIQYSISSGVAHVLQGEVATAQRTLRAGQRRGIKFEVVTSLPTPDEMEQPATEDTTGAEANTSMDLASPQPGHCADCHQPFYAGEAGSGDGMDTLVGFVCGHVFHLTHLLRRLHPEEPEDEQMRFGERHSHEDEDEGYAGAHRSVGSKVTRARLLKDRIQSGCPICADAKTKGDGRVIL